MPDRFTLQAGSIFGGAISAQGLARTGQVWGHQVTVGLANGGITGGVNIGRLWSNGHLEIGTGTIDSLIGGGDLWARAGGRSSPVSHWNFPRAASGRIAGRVFYDASRTQLPADESMAAIGILSGQAGTSPGLPGIPYCDARVKAVDVAPLKGQANYVFEMQGGVPMLTIQNVRTASGVSLDGSYNLATGDVRRLPTGTGAPFMTCNWQTDPNSAQAHCFRNTTVASGWNITGLVSFPPGVAWFDGPVTVDGTQNGRDLVNTIIATGRVNLTEAGHGDLVAPNFSTPQVVCGGDFWPTNLCDKSSGTPRFATWTDEEGQVHVGLPIGNVAVVTEGAARLAGWEIYGHLILGRELETGANVTVIHGTATVGANQAGSSTGVTQGGAQIVVPDNSDQMYLPNCDSTPPVLPGDARVLWTRYL
ncbi:MAG TPA: hypothetical protein VFF91_06145 [Pseudoxanthomonas sp.]|nr:hypothetical protein [Pseudoxanthomonas sp.]